MHRDYSRLTAAQVRKLAEQRTPGMYPDGDGLYLAISKAGVPSWSFRYMIAGRAREMGLGPVRDVTLSQAPQAAYEARQLKRQGIDSLDAPREKRQGAALAKAKSVSFGECAEAYIVAHRPSWTNAKHARQWSQSLADFAFPLLGTLPVETIDTGLVMRVQEPIWYDRPETAKRVRGRIETMLNWAKTRGYRDAENPPRWKGHIENLLPKRDKLSAVKHHPALPYREIAGLIAAPIG